MLPSPTIWFLLDRKQQSCNQGQKEMEMFWFFKLRFCRTYDSVYDADFWFSQGHKHSYDSTYDSNFDSVASENQPLIMAVSSYWVFTPL